MAEGNNNILCNKDSEFKISYAIINSVTSISFQKYSYISLFLTGQT
jgi:hypothetical protein